jgi:hypothetical protein
VAAAQEAEEQRQGGGAGDEDGAVGAGSEEAADAQPGADIKAEVLEAVVGAADGAGVNAAGAGEAVMTDAQ